MHGVFTYVLDDENQVPVPKPGLLAEVTPTVGPPFFPYPNPPTHTPMLTPYPTSACRPGFASLLRHLILSIGFLFLATFGQLRAASAVDIDIGNPGQPGDTVFTTGVYTLSGGGADIWNTSDQFHFNRGPLEGDGVVSARALSLTNTNTWAKAGVMLRADDTANAPTAILVITPGQGVSFQWRSVRGGRSSHVTVPGIKAPVWLRLSRSGNVITGSYSQDGTTWIRVGTPQAVTLGTVASAGLAVTAHNNAALCTALFTEVLALPSVDSRYLTTQVNELRDRRGRLVTLRGVNIGGWLVTESWMNGDRASKDSSTERWIEDRLSVEKGFNPTQVQTLMNAWYDNWIVANDLDNIKNFGFNCVRVPFSYRNLQDANGNWKLNALGKIDFSRFDWIVQEAGKRGLYVILDQHVWKGQKECYSLITNYGGEADVAAAAALMSEIAGHFKGQGGVAAIEILNEPAGSNNNYAAHVALKNAIRSKDPERLIIASWVQANLYPSLGFTNMMASNHYKAESAATLCTLTAANPAGQGGDLCSSTVLPYFMGEFKPSDAGTLLYQNGYDVGTGMNRLGWSWSCWTYKAVNQGGWALFNYNGDLYFDTSLASETYDTILDKWNRRLTLWTAPGNIPNYNINTALVYGLSDAAGTTPPVLQSGKSYAIVNYNSHKAIAAGTGAQNQITTQKPLPVVPPSEFYWTATQINSTQWRFTNYLGLAIDVDGGNMLDGGRIIQWPVNNSANQAWQILPVGDATYRICNATSSRELNVNNASLSDDAAVNQWSDAAGAKQEHWTFVPLN